jgi:hypothetical protein
MSLADLAWHHHDVIVAECNGSPYPTLDMTRQAVALACLARVAYPFMLAASFGAAIVFATVKTLDHLRTKGSAPPPSD